MRDENCLGDWRKEGRIALIYDSTEEEPRCMSIKYKISNEVEVTPMCRGKEKTEVSKQL